MSKDLKELFEIYSKHLKRSQFSFDHRRARIKSYLEYLEEKEIKFLTVDSVKRWIDEKYAPSSKSSWEGKYNDIRDFSLWANAATPSNEALPFRRQPKKKRRIPNILNETDAFEIINSIGSQNTDKGLSPLTVQTIVGLMFVTGLRIGEALALTTEDVDLNAGVIYVKDQKSPRDRYVPILEKTVLELKRYRKQCRRIHPDIEDIFFLFDNGIAKSRAPFYQRFHRACVATGHRPSTKLETNHSFLKPHDLRHSFTVNALIKCYKNGLNVFEEAAKLTTILGHKSVKETYWYTENTPELVSLAMEKARV